MTNDRKTQLIQIKRLPFVLVALSQRCFAHNSELTPYTEVHFIRQWAVGHCLVKNLAFKSRLVIIHSELPHKIAVCHSKLVFIDGYRSRRDFCSVSSPSERRRWISFVRWTMEFNKVSFHELWALVQWYGWWFWFHCRHRKYTKCKYLVYSNTWNCSESFINSFGSSESQPVNSC